MFPLGKNQTEYRRLSTGHVFIGTFRGMDMLVVEHEALRFLVW